MSRRRAHESPNEPGVFPCPTGAELAPGRGPGPGSSSGSGEASIWGSGYGSGQGWLAPPLGAVRAQPAESSGGARFGRDRSSEDELASPARDRSSEDELASPARARSSEDELASPARLGPAARVRVGAAWRAGAPALPGGLSTAAMRTRPAHATPRVATPRVGVRVRVRVGVGGKLQPRAGRLCGGDSVGVCVHLVRGRVRVGRGLGLDQG